MPDETREVILETLEAVLEAQLHAVRKLRRGHPRKSEGEFPQPRRSHMSTVEDILLSAAAPLHISEIIERAKIHFAQSLDRESLVSALTKRVARKDRFVRTAPNTFALRPTKHAKEAKPAS
jgi:hypothetical protein